MSNLSGIGLGLGSRLCGGVFPKASQSFLDQFTDAKIALSLRDLKGDDSDVVRVRRSTGGEQDFSPSEIASGALESYVGSGNDGFVVKWYDNSGAGNDFVNLTSSTQPKIVDNGSYLGYIEFDSNTKKLNASAITNLPSAVYSFHQVLANQNSSAFNVVAWQSSFNNYWYFASNAFNVAVNGGAVGAAGSVVTLGQFNQFSVGVGGVLEQLVVTKNNSAYASNTLSSFPPAAVTSLFIGDGAGIGIDSEFKIKELVYLGTDTAANNSAVAQNQIAYWGTPN